MQRECKLSIITINFNGIDCTRDLIETIPSSDDIEVIVVDNGSRRDEATELEKLFPNIHVVRSRKNLGFAGGNNLGIKASHGKYLFFVNNDTIFREFNAEALISRLETSENIGIVCPKIRFAWGNNPIQYAGFTGLSRITLRNRSVGYGEDDHGQYDTARPTPYAHGAAMLVRREAIERAGYMPECYFLYYEELDWSMMIHRAGYGIWYDPSCTIYHKESQATGQASPQKTYYLTRNRLLFAKRNFSFPILILTYIYLIFIVGSRDAMRYSLTHRKEHVKAVIRGITDFIKMKL